MSSGEPLGEEPPGEEPPGEEVEWGHPLYRMAVLTATALVVGGAASLAAVGFVECVALLNDMLLISPRMRVQYEDAGWVVPAATVSVPVAGGVVVGLLLHFASKDRRPLGPPDVIAAVQFRMPLPSVRSGVVSTVAAGLSLGFGASVGQYGPMVYLGAMIGGVFKRLPLHIPNLPAIAIACGVAAAISTAFNAPIAGLVFAHEVVLRHYSTQAFAPTTVASATGYVIANVIFERPALFLVDFAGVAHGYEFALFGLLGVVAAGAAIGFMHLVLYCVRLGARMGERVPVIRAIRPAFAGLAVGLTALWLPDVLGIGQETLRFATIEGAFETGELLVLVLAKIGLTALCIGFGFAGGVFSPALLIGILLGALFWTLLAGTGWIATSGIAVYAICGMMAMTSPVIGAPLTTILIVFELTRNYDITIAAMVAVVFSNLITHRVFGRSLFDVQLARKGIDLSGGRDQARLDAIAVSRVCRQDFLRAEPTAPAVDVRRRLGGSEWSEAFVVDPDGRFEGMVRDKHLVTVASDAQVRDVMRPPRLRFDEGTTVVAAMRAVRDYVGDAVPVVHSKDGRLVGVVTEAAIIQAYLDVSRHLREEENAAL